MSWHPSHYPHTNHSPEKYWHGVATIQQHSNFEQPRVGVRPGPADQARAFPPAAQPAISAGAQLDTAAPDASSWQPDQHVGM